MGRRLAVTSSIPPSIRASRAEPSSGPMSRPVKGSLPFGGLPVPGGPAAGVLGCFRLRGGVPCPPPPGCFGLAVCVLVGTGFGELVRVAVGRGDAVGLDGVVGVAVADGTTEMMWLVTLDEQMTTAPPPLPEPTHWLMVTGSAAVFVDVVTVHRTRLVPPPPLPELLHWVTVAPVVLPIGEHTLVGRVPPPVPAELH
jgi:hypothetical protein